MANLAAKLGQTILTKTKEGISDFGQGMKGAFISANPDVFGPAAQYLEKKLTKDTKDQKKEKTEDTRRDKEKEQRSQGFFEENFLEDRKMQQDTLLNIVGINKNTASIDRTAKEILELLKKCCDCKCNDSLLPKITDLLKGGLGAIAGAIAALSTARLTVPTVPGPIFPPVKIPVPGVATPISTPVASPVATPVATPVSTTAPFSTTSQVSSVIENTIVRNVSGLLEGVRPSITNVAGSLENFNTRVNLLTEYYNSVIESAVRLKISNDYAVERVNSVSETSGRLSSSLAEVPERVTRLVGAIETSSSEIIKLGNATTESVLKITNQTNLFTEQLNTVLRNLERVPAMVEANYAGQGAPGSAGAGGPRIGGSTSSVTPVVPPMRLGGGGGGTGAPALGYSGGGQPPGTSVALTGDPGRFTGAAPYRGPGIGPGPVTDIWLSPMDRIKYGLGVTSEFIKNNFGAATESIKSGFGAVTTAVSSGYGQFSSAAQDVENKIFGGKFGVGLAALGTGAAFIEGLIDEKALAEALQIDESQITGRDRLYGAMGTVVGRTAAVPFDLATAALKGGATIADYYTGYDFRKQLDENISVGDIGKASSVGWTRIIGAIGGIGPERFKQERPLGNTPWTSSSWGADVLSKAFLKEDYEKTHGPYSIPPIDPYIGGGPGFNTTMTPTNVSDVKGREGWMRVYQLAAAAGDKYPEITASQWAQETGWGKKIPTDSNNIFGIKARPGEPFVTAQTEEFKYELQKNVPETARFKKYDSVEEAVADRVNRWSPRYASAQNVDQAVQMLVKTGYATDPNYGNAIRSIIAQQTSLGLPSIDSSPRVTAAKAEEQLKTTVQIADATQSTSKTQESALGELRQSVQLSYDQIRQQELTRIQAQDDARRQFEEYRKTEDEKRKRLEGYENERRRLQQQFDSQMQGIFRPMVDALKGPNNTPEAMVNAGKNLSNFLKDDFTKLGVSIFGKQYGAAIGGTFQQLAGVYMNQFINESLAPALGMNADILNRSINTYVKGVELIDPKLKQVNESLAKSRGELDKFVQEKGDITQADIVRAAGRKGGFTPEQKEKLAKLTAMRENIAKQEAAASALKAQKKEYKDAALEDLVYGMTGVSLGPRTMLDQYAGGAEGLTKDLASFFGAPFNPAFGLSDKDAVAYKKLQAESALYQRQLQGLDQTNKALLTGQTGVNDTLITKQTSVNEAYLAAQATNNSNLISAQNQTNDSLISRFGDTLSGVVDRIGSVLSSGIDNLRNSFSGGGGGGSQNPQVPFDPTSAFGLANMEPAGSKSEITDLYALMDRDLAGEPTIPSISSISQGIEGLPGSSLPKDIAASVSAGVESGFKKSDKGTIVPFSGGGTAIPGYTGPSYISRGANLDETGTPIQGPLNFYGQGVGSATAGGRLMNFGENMLYNMVGGKIGKSLGGGPAGNFVGQLAQGALRGAVTGKGTIIQNIGSQFGAKLAPNAGITDLFGAFNSMASKIDPIANMGKMGMNMMQSLMPQGASGPLGQFGFDFFSGMGAGGNFFKNVGSALSSGGSFMGSFGANAAGTGMNIGNFLGQAAGSLGPIIQGFQYGKMAKNLIGGQYSVSKGYSKFQDVGIAVASAMMGPIGGAIAGAVSGLVNRAFGRKAKEVKGSGIEGTFTSEGVQNLQNFTNFFQKGGWFRSDKSWTETSAADSETVKAFSEVLQGTTKTVKDLGKIIGLDPAKVAGFQKAIKINLQGMNEEQQKAAIEKAFQEYGSDLVGYSFKNVAKFQRQGEDTMQTLEALAKSTQTFSSTITSIDVNKLLGIDTIAGVTNLAMSEGLDLGGDLIKGWFKGSKNKRLIEEAATQIVDSFTGALSDNAKKLDEFIKVNTADFKRSLIEAYGGEETFKKVEEGLFDALYTPEQKLEKIKERSMDSMLESAKQIEEAGGAISPDKIAELSKMSFEETQKYIQGQLDEADKRLKVDPNNKALQKQYADIRTAAYNFLTSSKNYSEVAKQQEENEKRKENKTGSNTPMISFDPSKYIPLVDELGNIISSSTAPDKGFTRPDANTVVTAETTTWSNTKTGEKFYTSTTGWIPPSTDWVIDVPPGGRAKGGWFRKRTPMIVGEVGPEVMVPDFAGTIVPTHKIIEAVQNASSLDSQTRNLLETATPTSNPINQIYLELEGQNTRLKEEQKAIAVNSAVVDNSVTTVSSPKTNIVSRSEDVRSNHPVAGMFTRSITRARM